MQAETIKGILEKYKNGAISSDEALKAFSDFPFKDLGFAKIDTQREIRVGYPEVVYCAGKSLIQIKTIFEFAISKGGNVLGTRATEEAYQEVLKLSKSAVYNSAAKTICVIQKDVALTSSYIAVASAGTSDLPVAEEAAVTAEVFGCRVERIVDVGVAGIHRLFAELDRLRAARVIIAVAGMEGALPGVIAGLVDKPVIAVPTSVGYGANFGGLSALLTMLNSCAAGVSVVNIDNGFGAGYLGAMINKI